MAWGKAGSTTLSSAGDSIEITGFTTQTTMTTLFHNISDGAMNVFWRYNNDTGSNYCDRYNNNGGSDGTSVNQTANWGYLSSASAHDNFAVNYILNVSGEEKLTITSVVDTGGSGAGSAPNRVESVQKYIPSPDADITEIDVFNTGTGSFDTDSNISVLGSDMTPAPAVTFASDVTPYTRAEITDTRKMYSLYGASTATYETDFSSDPTISSNDSGNNYYDSTNDRWYIQWDWDNTNDAGSIDLYSKIGNQNLSDDDWTVRFKYTIVSQNFTSGSDSKQFFIGLTSTDYSNAFWYPDSSNVSTNFGLYMDKNGTYQLYTNDNSAYGSGTWTNTSRSLSNETLYVELIRENSTTAKMNLYSDSSYSTLLVGVSLTIASGLTGLRYLSVKGMRYSSSGTVTSNMDDLEIYNDVSSVLESPTWKEKGTT